MSMTIGHNLDRYEGEKLMYARQAAYKAARFPVEILFPDEVTFDAPLYSEFVDEDGCFHI